MKLNYPPPGVNNQLKIFACANMTINISDIDNITTVMGPTLIPIELS